VAQGVEAIAVGHHDRHPRLSMLNKRRVKGDGETAILAFLGEGGGGEGRHNCKREGGRESGREEEESVFSCVFEGLCARI
jgi:hypothetical protein